jgi:hypothetical protein
MKKFSLLLIVATIFCSCSKDNSKLKCMECVDNTGTITCQPFKQTEDWAKANTTNASRYHILPDASCR